MRKKLFWFLIKIKVCQKVKTALFRNVINIDKCFVKYKHYISLQRFKKIIILT